MKSYIYLLLSAAVLISDGRIMTLTTTRLIKQARL